MSKLRLAVSAVSFLVVLAVVPGFAQTPPSSASPQTPSAASDENKTLPDEELARLYMLRKQYREAQEIFHRLTVEHPKNAQYWNELGITYHNQQELGAALKCYEKSVKLDKEYADPQNNIGTIYYERKKYPKAIRAYKRAIAVKGDSAVFYLNLGYAYFADKQSDQFVAALRQALQLDPKVLEAGRSRAGSIVQDRSVAEDRARFDFLWAKTLAEAGDLEHCIVYLKKARDEGYKDLNSVNTDPSFAKVVNEPAIQEILAPKPSDTVRQ